MHTSAAGPDALDATRMTPVERFSEIGRILALGVMRLHAGKSTALFANRGDSYLDFPPDQRSHAATLANGKA
jgi:hypothetical protein